MQIFRTVLLIFIDIVLIFNVLLYNVFKLKKKYRKLDFVMSGLEQNTKFVNCILQI